jgi:hypothetical protein
MTNGESLHWRPISTAPRDQNVLIYSLRWGAIMATLCSRSRTWRPSMRFPAEFDGADEALITHWMPLPAVPAELTGSRSPWQSLAA